MMNYEVPSLLRTHLSNWKTYGYIYGYEHNRGRGKISIFSHRCSKYIFSSVTVSNFLRGKSFSYKKDTSIRVFVLWEVRSPLPYSSCITSICDARTFSHFFKTVGVILSNTMKKLLKPCKGKPTRRQPSVKNRRREGCFLSMIIEPIFKQAFVNIRIRIPCVV